MRIINPTSCDINSFKYSIIIPLHYNDIPIHRERLSYLKAYENKYNFIYVTPPEFEINNPNLSQNIFEVYISSLVSLNVFSKYILLFSNDNSFVYQNNHMHRYQNQF